jgi:hypothetical protein
MELQINKDELYIMLKKAVREVLEEERFNFVLKNLTPISSEEMRDIEKTYGSPSKKREVFHSKEIDL